MRGPHRFGMSAMFLLFTLSAACGGDSPPPTGPGDTPGDGEFGSIQVTVSTVGLLIDSNGYDLSIDGGERTGIEVDGSRTFTGLAVGEHTVEIDDIAGNCRTTGQPIKTVTVLGEAAAEVDFEVDCEGWESLSSGSIHSCGLLGNGSAYCWGSNHTGVLGDGTTEDRPTPVPVDFEAFVQIAAGNDHSCGLDSAGIAYCWGLNPVGGIGDGTTTTRLTPTQVDTDLRFEALTAGANHTCGVTSAGKAYCWGGNENGELGDGTNTNRLTPVAVAGGLTFRQLSAGWSHSCGVTDSGAAYCWGWNGLGQLGEGTTADRATPQPVSGGLLFNHVAAAPYQTCGVTTTGEGHCWGENEFGSLGAGFRSPYEVLPVRVDGLPLLLRIDAGGSFACGVSHSRLVHCWGFNENGAVGDGTFESPKLVPSPVAGGLEVQSLSVGDNHACVITQQGEAFCWGYGYSYQLGNGVSDLSNIPARVLDGW